MISCRVLRTLAFLCLVLPASSLYAQQTGTVSGTVSTADGATLPGVTVEATSNVLPSPRVTTTGNNGDYRLPALPPGDYTLKFALAGMATVTRTMQVQLAIDTDVDVTMGLGGVTETVEVSASSGLVDRDSASIKTAIAADQIQAMPVGQQYRDLVKLIPAVQLSQDITRGPSAGGSGQDNVYQFDGVNVTLPLFGTLSAEPAAHDIAQVTVIKGGATATDFNRSGGFAIDSVSRSGTNRFSGLASFQVQTSNMSAELAEGTTATLSQYDQDRSWVNLNVGGPVIREKLLFYASYFRPESTRDNRANLYGDLPEYESTRNEGFGKLTFTPTSSTLFNVSYRDSERTETSSLFAATATATSGSGSEASLAIGTADGSWVIDARSYLSFKYTHFANKTQGRPDFVSDAVINTAPGTQLDINSLDTLGRFTVPVPIAGQAAFNNFIQPIINRYGFIDGAGNRAGGGIVGYGDTFDDIDFYRDAAQVAYNIMLGSTVRHDLHVGYQHSLDSEELVRSSNGWGLFSVPGGRLSFQGTPIFYTAAFQQQGVGLVPRITSEFRSQSIEVNDTIRWNNWSFNAGLLFSRDTLYGQGLREDESALSGFVAASGNRYEMLDLGFGKMIQPRVGATWAYNGNDTVYASYARYNPSASSLPRAASWDRNLATTIQAHFDQNGVLFATTPVAGSTGKLFVDDITPRRIDEFLVGTARQFTSNWSARLYGRYREGSHFWEDTNNNARVVFSPPEDIPRELYIPDLADKLAQIGTGGSASSYVIAELDGAYTKYQEVTLESEWRGKKAFVRGSYTWSHYYGNFDQDNTTAVNDSNIFIGSSFIGDGAGRQLWNFRDGDLRGDRPHMLKLYGYYLLDWHASVGAFFVAQSGQPWEIWSFEPYIDLTTSTSDSSRFAEPAGSRRTDMHTQLDLNYTQDLRLARWFNIQLAADLFNVFNKQTAYNIDSAAHSGTFQIPRTSFDPRRVQVAFRVRF